MRSEVNAIMLFIAELTGSFEAGTGNQEDKIKCGQQDYITNNLLELDLTTEDDRKDLHENIWLERLYKELDEYFAIPTDKFARNLALDLEGYREETYKWSVPLELDASCSLMQFIGVLLNDKRMMEMTNVIGDTLEDPWHLEGLSRKMLKEAATPALYGSSKLCSDLWKKAGMKFTDKDVATYRKEMSEGAFGLANMFKDFLINNCNPSPEMQIKIGNDNFSVNCNRFRNVGEKLKAYSIWDSVDRQYNIILHTDTKKVPDLEQFRRFFPTLLIHNLDSQVADIIVGKVMGKYGWGISLHDAIICGPQAAADARKWYGEQLKLIHENRKEILSEFFKSIGISALAANEWENIKSKVHQLESELIISMPLK